jgi:hypothetical protein
MDIFQIVVYVLFQNKQTNKQSYTYTYTYNLNLS